MLDEVASSRSASWRKTVQRHQTGTLRRVQDDLTTREVITLRSHRAFGVAPTVRITPVNPASVRELHDHVAELLRGAVPVHRIDRADAALVGLSDAGHLLCRHIPRSELRQHRHRIDALAEHAGPAVPAVRMAVKAAIRRSRAASVAIVTSGTPRLS